MIDFRDTPEEAAFRAELRAWLARTLETFELPSDINERDRAEAAWHRVLYAGGWMGLSWPVELGGKGLPPVYEAILNDELGDAGAPPPPAIGFLGRALQLFGTTDQQRAFLPGLLSGEVQWCQGFSEPDAGSDLASLRTHAEPVDGGYRVTGQKVWTSRAAWADWCLLLARTDPGAGKHAGISSLMVNMRSPGIEVRPIMQITGSTRFNEVFFDSVFVPAENRIGAEGEGWRVAMATVQFERSPADTGYAARYRRALRQLEALYREGRLPAGSESVLGRLHVEIEALRLHVLANLANRGAGGPGSVSSVDKLLMIRAEQRLGHAILELLEPCISIGAELGWANDYFRSRAASIYGGTEQIQKNIVAQRLLDLPRGSR